MGVVVGTSGFSYDDWRGVFYPEGTAQREMLEYYAGKFPAVELNYTYYRMPAARAMAAMVRRVPSGFEFCVKAFQGMTHERPSESAEARTLFEEFGRAMAPLREVGQLGCVLLQFPWSFKYGPEGLGYLSTCADLMGGLPAVVEFRNSGWVAAPVRQEVFDRLRQLQFGFCSVDEPRLHGLMPRLAVATGDVGYVRFHGRNAKKWWTHGQASERYDYLYSREELEEWTDKIEQLARETKKTYVFFNNCHAGQAATNASMMAGLLGLRPPE
jgi:uncharacterized protein YecE (DUF72 family)